MRAMTWIDAPPTGALPQTPSVPMEQHGTHARVAASLGWTMRRFVRGSVARPDASALVRIKRWPGLGHFAVLERGPVWSDEMDTAARLAAFARLMDRLRADYRGVMATPDRIAGQDPGGGPGWLTTVTPCHLASIPLARSEEELRAGLHGKWRNRLVKAEASGLKVTRDVMPAHQGHWLLRAEAMQRHQRRYAGASDAYTLAWLASGDKNAALYVARRGKTPVAAMLFLTHPPGASYHIGWSGPEGRSTHAHNLILWTAMVDFARSGHAFLDLDLVDTETAPGLARFKLGTGARVIPLGATRLAAPGTGLIAALLRPASIVRRDWTLAASNVRFVGLAKGGWRDDRNDTGSEPG